MIEIFTGMLIGAYLFYNYISDEEIINKVISLFAGAVVGILVGVFVAMAIGSFLPASPVKTDSVNLAALRDNISTTGSFFLGSGSVNGELKYYYYADLGHSRYRSSSAPADETTIIEDNPSQPHLDTYTSEPKENWWRWFAMTPRQGSEIEFYEFHIPAGSIVKNYNLNLGK